MTDESSDGSETPIITLIRRTLREEERRSGMRVGMAKVKIDATHLQRVLLEYDAMTKERDALKARVEELEKAGSTLVDSMTGAYEIADVWAEKEAFKEALR